MAGNRASLWLAMAGVRARRFVPAALAGALLAMAGYDLVYWVAAIRSAPLVQDSSIYYVAAQIGRAHGWDRIYDVALQTQFLAGLHAGIGDPRYFLYANPPPLAWLFAPLTLVAPLAAYFVVAALSVVALVAASSLVAGSAVRTRILYALGAMAWYPVVYSLRLGQVSLLVGALVVFSWWLDRRGSPYLAGAALAMTAIKPQLVLLVAPCLLIAGRHRLFVSWLLTTLALALASALSLGASGLGQYLHVLTVVRAATYNDHFTLAALGGGSLVTIMLQGLAAGLTLVVAYRVRRDGTAVVIAVALVGGLLAAPYLHVDDFAVLAPAAWLLLRDATSMPLRLWLVPMAVSMELAWVLGPLPILAALTISLLLLLFPRPEPQSIELAA